MESCFLCHCASGVICWWAIENSTSSSNKGVRLRFDRASCRDHLIKLHYPFVYYAKDRKSILQGVKLARHKFQDLEKCQNPFSQPMLHPAL